MSTGGPDRRNLGSDPDWRSPEVQKRLGQGLKHAGLPRRRFRLIIFDGIVKKFAEIMRRSGIMVGFGPPMPPLDSGE